jgi:hypothetical protein
LQQLDSKGHRPEIALLKSIFDNGGKMRALLLALPILLFTTALQAKEVYRCDDGSRSFTVSKDKDGTYVGSFQDFTGKPEKFECEHTARGYNYRCNRGDYIATVRRGASGDMLVDFELIGDFYPDSGYLFQLSCDN